MIPERSPVPQHVRQGVPVAELLPDASGRT